MQFGDEEKVVSRRNLPRLDDDLLLLAGSLVPRVHVDDAIGVNVEGDLNLTFWQHYILAITMLNINMDNTKWTNTIHIFVCPSF